MPISFSCPACGSDHTRSVSVIFSEQTRRSRSATRGGDSFYSIGYNARTHSRSQSDLAKAIAPPRRHRVIAGMIGVACLMLWLLAMTHSMLLAAFSWLPVVAYGVFAWRANRRSEPARIAWAQRFLCLRCGHQFNPTAHSGDVPSTASLQ